MSETSMHNLLSFQEIVKGKSFKIPEYQRGYAWDSDQVRDLYEDIENLISDTSKDSKHFTGTVVAVDTKKKFKDMDDLYEIVDGQQRFTTLIILLMTLAEVDKSHASAIKEICYRGKEGNERELLTANKETEDYFRRLIFESQKIQSPREETKSHVKIREAKKVLLGWLKKKQTEGHLKEVVDVVLHRLGFIFFIPQKDKEVGIMFEVINNRGKPLSELEKIKNYFIYYCSIHEQKTILQKINTAWGDILKHLNLATANTNEEENSFLRNCYLVFFDPTKKDSWEPYHSIKGRYEKKKDHNNSIKEIERFVKFLEKTSLFYAYLRDGEERILPPEMEKRESLRYLRHHPVDASILPLYFSIMPYVHEESDKEVSKKAWKLLKILEILNFRVYILPKVTGRADAGQSRLFELASNLYHKQMEGAHNDMENLKKCEQGMIEFTKKMCSQTDFVESLTIDEDEAEDYFYWRGILYFLARYEQHLRSEKQTYNIQEVFMKEGPKSNDTISKEHIWAKKNRDEDFPQDHRQKRRLGNFTLMGLGNNIGLRDDDIDKKIKDIKTNFSKFNLKQVLELTDLWKTVEEKIQYSRRSKNYYRDLSKILNDLRETKLIQFALDNWKLDGEDPEFFTKCDSFSEEANSSGKYYVVKREAKDSQEEE